MNWFVRIVVLTLAALVLTAPISPSSDCDQSHDEDCTSTCVCACHSVMPFADAGSIPGLASPTISDLCIAGDTFVDNLLPVDIFRPPAAA